MTYVIRLTIRVMILLSIMAEYPDSTESVNNAGEKPVHYYEPSQPTANHTDQLTELVQRLMRVNQELEAEVRQKADLEQHLRSELGHAVSALERERVVSGSMSSRFSSLASHEFRTPLSTILSSATLARRYAEDGNITKRDQHLEKIRLMVHHLNNILQDFLSLNDLESNKIKLSITQFDLNQLLNECIEAIQQQERSNLKITLETPADPIEVVCDQIFISQIMQNLLSNAARYSNGEVHCKVAFQSADLIISVKDNGIGIPEAEQINIFNQFFRATNAAHIPGIGLGLYTSKRYLEMLGGRISFESNPDKGTTFTIVFPRICSQKA